jgi:hypothetical protein
MKKNAMMRIQSFWCCLCVFAFSNAQTVDFSTDEFRLSLDSAASVIHLIDKSDRTDYIIKDKRSPLISLLINKNIVYPEKAFYTNHNNNIRLKFANNIIANVSVQSKKGYLRFSLQSISNESIIDAVIWGPYETSIHKSVGETIGIVQNEKFTIGLQALSIKTLGGYPWNDNDHLPQLDIFSQDDFDDVKKAKKSVLYSVEAAKPTQTGSSLQAYTRNRNKDRIIENWGHTKFVAPAYNDGGLVGSSIAIFGCISDTTLDRIGEIEIKEGLPHPLIDGVWVKKSKVINASYLIMDFSEQNIDQAIAVTKKVGFNYLYHSDPFETWGHYSLKKEFFPSGYEGLKNCVDEAMQNGIRIGTHTLTNFINTNDSYVTPVPDKRLAIVGSSKLMTNIDEKQTDLIIERPDFFNQFANNNLQSVIIDNEIIRYGSVSDKEPWVLKDCQRGTFGTSAAAHQSGNKVSKLFDHGYKVFLGNASLNKEIAENIANVFNKTGIRMLDFDGLEGAGSTGMGNYAEALFAKAWYDHLNDDIKSHFLLGASRSGHYFWHIYSRMNWGEPWYAGFRESQTEYRLFNQKYFKRNLMPGMLGWFKMTPSTSIEDIEWLMARSAGYKAGFAFVTDFNAVRSNGNSEEIFASMKLWEQARLKGVFTANQEKRMQNVSTEFHLEKKLNDSLLLTEIISYKFKHEKKDLQPGAPLNSTFDFDNASTEQIPGFIITVDGDDISNIEMEINHYKKLVFPFILKNGQTIKCTNGNTAIVYDKNWNIVNVTPINVSFFKVTTGKQILSFDCTFSNKEAQPSVKIEIRLKGESEMIPN